MIRSQHVIIVNLLFTSFLRLNVYVGCWHTHFQLNAIYTNWTHGAVLEHYTTLHSVQANNLWRFSGSSNSPTLHCGQMNNQWFYGKAAPNTKFEQLVLLPCCLKVLRQNYLSETNQTPRGAERQQLWCHLRLKCWLSLWRRMWKSDQCDQYLTAVLPW